MSLEVHIVGAGLAGSEAAWQSLKQGLNVVLHEMRPTQLTEAHKSGDFAELVCSNSLKSLSKESASGRLKSEMESFDSLIMTAALQARVPAGGALAVNRSQFSAIIRETLEAQPGFRFESGAVEELPSEEELQAQNSAWLVATGPLTSKELGSELARISGHDSQELYFYDAIAPILAADSIDLEHCFVADRWSDQEGGDYLNIPMSKEQYLAFAAEVQSAEKMPLHSFEKPKYFEACLPIEVLFERGIDTPRFGPLKPVGLIDPKLGRHPYAVIQLRKENLGATMYSMVGFQTKMKWPEQKRIFANIPALANAEFLRYGSVHRNSYLHSPKVLNSDLSFCGNNRIFAAGQITGVEGYLESAAMGLLAARFMTGCVRDEKFPAPPRGSILGGLLNYVTVGPLGDFSPMNANLGILPPAEKSKKRMSKADRRRAQCERAGALFDEYLINNSILVEAKS